ncbi:SgcJ/EcaC family oxidoreductase [Bradyrhizobium sp. CB3481]|uniref:SgcJ/EcaC family oxidoreductase n=1 Tax=Bradyrhizobium sp. CB3481 TaxID=3039158 RepID=UPI0024B239D5|nr:SgcJ/EcaC family oxidoreductase [Bradyrhizobium sp. CB3481]WFU18709.1 SgcJ/EcaC family oxidoreductase [Bradyrhizobium sp. CB3481]
MIKNLFALTLLATVMSSSANAKDEPQEAAIRAIVADQVAAWDAGDGARFCQSAAPDISAFNTSGADMSGKEVFCQRQLQILGGIFKGTTKKQVIRRLRFITDDVAVVDIDNEIHGLKATPSGAPLAADGVSRTRLMEVFVRRDGRWLMEAFYNIDIKSPK